MISPKSILSSTPAQLIRIMTNTADLIGCLKQSLRLLKS
ncbi:hypothetical protein STRMA_0344 [Streptococcus macacae NCTC 11558]|uniref:Uncharacterized protein n=1 Tax=Streptococcus macacae NCTC 11558 TaxID=764298 RepID=G5JYT0_9STRE|nr:hypothetical protein STRMA_0344 [Streptococcus macacae NCTC 11558]